MAGMLYFFTHDLPGLVNAVITDMGFEPCYQDIGFPFRSSAKGATVFFLCHNQCIKKTL
jgi:hypothetical protein